MGRHEERIEDLEALVATLFRLNEAEDLARDVYPEALKEILEIHDQTVEAIIARAESILRIRPGLHGPNPKVPLEVLERYFEALKQAAELEWLRSQKLKRVEARKARQMANHLAKLTHNAALAIKVVAQARGQWSEDYRDRLGINPWI